MICFPNAKINLGLFITEKLPNGYHALETCFYPVPIHDALEAVEAKKTSFHIAGSSIPGDPNQNLILKAYRLLKKDYQLPELEIHLLKNIPMGAGLGGGSSDAAFMLRLLSETYQLFLDDIILEDYAAQIGSDCPFFIANEPAIGTGTGTDLEPIELSLKGLWLALIHPGIHISTKEAYAGVSPKESGINIRELIQSLDFKLWEKELKNNFEASIFPQHPQLKLIKDNLYESGAVYSAMSGSGSAMFGLFNEKPELNWIDDAHFSSTIQL